MQSTSILAPVFALAGMTFLVLLLVPIRRFQAAFAGQVTAEDFKLGESARVPSQVAVANRNYMNLLEVPLLFYVICGICFVTHSVDRMIMGLAWTFVVLRALHSLVHITYNNVFHRLMLFATSVVVLVLLWSYSFFRIFA